jgi:hypothetical protein
LVKFIEKKKREQRKHTVDDGFKELLLGLWTQNPSTLPLNCLFLYCNKDLYLSGGENTHGTPMARRKVWFKQKTTERK